MLVTLDSWTGAQTPKGPGASRAVHVLGQTARRPHRRSPAFACGRRGWPGTIEGAGAAMNPRPEPGAPVERKGRDVTTATEPPPRLPSAVEAPYDLTIDLFSRMVESGLIPQDRRVFLLNGRLYEKMAKTKAHGSVGAGITMTLVPQLPAGWSLWPESTIALDPTNAPLPDFAVVRSGDLLGRVSPDRYPG